MKVSLTPSAHTQSVRELTPRAHSGPGMSPGKRKAGSSFCASSSPLVLAARNAAHRILRVRKKPATISYYPFTWGQGTGDGTHMLSPDGAERSTELTCPWPVLVLHSLWYSHDMSSMVHFQGSSKMAILPPGAPIAAPNLPSPNTRQMCCISFHNKLYSIY